MTSTNATQVGSPAKALASIERPILFDAQMVRAIKRGEKTQTRCLVQVPECVRDEAEDCEPDEDRWYYTTCAARPGYPNEFWAWMTEYEDDLHILLRPPYGIPGNRLWVKETWSPDAKNVYPCDPYLYRADVTDTTRDDPKTAEHIRGCSGNSADCYACVRELRGFRWRSGTTMPRVAARFLLEVTGVRVERLQEITEEDAMDEGVGEDRSQILNPDNHLHRWAFWRRWEQLAEQPNRWNTNPWVWVTSFRRVYP